MEPMNIDFTGSLSTLTNPCAEVLIPAYSFSGSSNVTELYKEYVNYKIRKKMGGDRGIHIGYKDNKIQHGH